MRFEVKDEKRASDREIGLLYKGDKKNASKKWRLNVK